MALLRTPKDTRIPRPTDAQLLAFEAKYRKHTSRKEAEIPKQLGIAPARYYILLGRLIWLEEALLIDPMLTNALRRKAAKRLTR